MNQRLTHVLDVIGPLNATAMAEARARQDVLTKPRRSLGRLEDLSVQIAGIRGSSSPSLRQKLIVTMAADHGVVAEGVSAYPQAVTRQMVDNFIAGGAAINVLARHISARVLVVDMGVVGGVEPQPGLVCQMIDFGTGNMARGPAMSASQAEDALVAGIEVLEAEIERGVDIVGAGDMGIGNTTASAAICAVATGRRVEEVTGRGAGLDDAQMAHKIAVIRKALEVNRPDPGDPLDVLAKVGGFEIGGLAGLMLAAAAHRIPVVLDGFNSGAAALIAAGLSPMAGEYFIAAHMSAEPGHAAMLEHMGLSPLLDLGMRLGEGTGAALGITLAEAAVRLLTQMATFDEAGVSNKE